MRKLIVSNFVTVDGYYEGKDKSIKSLFDYEHEDYAHDDSFDFYNAERLHAADFLLLSRNAFLGNKGYWPGVMTNLNATAIRRETAELMSSIHARGKARAISSPVMKLVARSHKSSRMKGISLCC